MRQRRGLLPLTSLNEVMDRLEFPLSFRLRRVRTAPQSTASVPAMCVTHSNLSSPAAFLPAYKCHPIGAAPKAGPPCTLECAGGERSCTTDPRGILSKKEQPYAEALFSRSGSGFVPLFGETSPRPSVRARSVVHSDLASLPPPSSK